METIILASASPRRHAILKRLELPFQTAPQDIDETFTDAPALEQCRELSRRKAAACRSRYGPHPGWILGADTFVVQGKTLLGKPSHREDAFRMLRLLQGQTHQVLSALTLLGPEEQAMTETAVTDVSFAPMSDAEIEWYLDQNEWRGVAASYRIQEKGALFVRAIKGSYSNVMGLPINTFYGMLRSQNYPLAKR